MFEPLIQEVKRIRDEKQQAVEDIDARIASLNEERLRLTAPLDKEEQEVIAQYKDKIIENGASWKCEVGGIAFRNGAHRVTYKWEVVDTVMASLKDTAPNLAKQLKTARKETVGDPSFSVEIYDGTD
jgi:N-methylhydantoinase B/oxoprolinase/acetone carboxylase alpha subunit